MKLVFHRPGKTAVLLILIAVLSGCGQQTGLGTYVQNIAAKNTAYTVKVTNVGQDSNGRITVGIQSTGANSFRNIPKVYKPPVGAYIVNGDDEYRYQNYSINDDIITFTFDAGINPDRIMVYPEEFPDDVLLHKAFNGRTKEAVRFYIPGNFAIDLNTLLQQNKVSAKITGRSMDRTAVSITNYHFTVIPVKIGIGMWFNSFSHSTQDMAVTKDVCFIVEPHKSYTVTVPTACMNSDKNVPDRADGFSARRINAFSKNKELVTLLHLLRKNNISDEMIQRAVWILTDDDVDYRVNNLDAEFGTNELENRLLGLIDRFLGTSLKQRSDDHEITATKRIIRQVHKPKRW